MTQNWWIFHDIVRQVKRKVQYTDNEKNGLCLIYQKDKLKRVEKYIHDRLTGKWASVSSFSRDNPEISLLNL